MRECDLLRNAEHIGCFYKLARSITPNFAEMLKKCTSCRLVNDTEADVCARCAGSLLRVAAVRQKPAPRAKKAAIRIGFCLATVLVIIAMFFVSLLATSHPLRSDQRERVEAALSILHEKGFHDESVYLDGLAVFRSSDNWFNALIPKENAFAATNFPFAIITVYPDFFAYPQDDVERAAILLHEARHLVGGDEPDAYGFVWKNRHKLGWTRDKYADSAVWANIRRQTREQVPNLFACPDREFDDCTEWASR